MLVDGETRLSQVALGVSGSFDNEETCQRYLVESNVSMPKVGGSPSLFAIGTGKDKQLTKGGTVRWPKASPDAMKIAYVDYERAPWDQGVLWTCYVGDLLLGDEIP